ncbi:type II toxin-antitoxin system RelE/ParE family toxin [Hyphobacterium sp. CCMP332]|uniref:type II toxin-antitoxin system RelE family toxin n=1 Tax=Hyphobacterium sp. CCMP332 TaxID=2749086 RepID=UPI00164F38DA|nr:type II toxin-antitoxin system RelE/ParE family toxin [Hyphobacterium sp. CCMP332]
MRSVSYTKSALKVLRKMSRPDALRIMAEVDQFAIDPESLANNVKRLQGSDFIRLRVGDWRVIMDDQGAVLAVIRIGPRGSVYE